MGGFGLKREVCRKILFSFYSLCDNGMKFGSLSIMIDG